MTDPLIAVTQSGQSDASSRARVFSWIERTNISARVFETGSLFDPRRLVEAEREARTADSTVLLSRCAHPLGRGIPERRLLSKSGFGVYDLDDGLPFDDGRLPFHGKWWKPLFPKSQIAESAAIAADRVIAGNEVLANWATKFCSDVVIIPTCVDPADYVQKISWEIDGVPTIVWMGSPATEPHLFSAREALAQLSKSLRFRLLLISSGNRAIPDAMAPFTERLAWDLQLQRSILARCDVGIMPLPDLPYERAKCGYKLLQYAACGLPFVGSPVGANQRVLEIAGMPGATTTSDWVDSLRELVEEGSEKRMIRGLGARRAILEHYSYDTFRTQWLAAVKAGKAAEDLV